MKSPTQDLQMYQNFDELAQDVIELTKEIMPDKLIYLTSIVDQEQVILKLSDENSTILLSEGMVFDLNDTVCNRINFERQQPLIYENAQVEIESEKLQELLKQVNINSYLGIPIALKNGEIFGTLCVANDKESHYDSKSVQLLQRIVRMFSYYLELERRAYRDALTDLYNRHYLYNYFDKNPNQQGTLFFIDLDGFKYINDNYGHDQGDQILKEVADRLRAFTKDHPETMAVRIGGDEFVIHCSHQLTEPEIQLHANHLLETLSRWEDGYPLSASIGIVTYSNDHELNIRTLIKQVDEALYQAKTDGKNRYQVNGSIGE